MLNTIIEETTALSESMSNTIYASLAWSGATRAANAVTYSIDGNTGAEIAPFLALASLSNKITTAELKPTVEQVIALLKTAPEQETPTKASIKLLKEAGEDVKDLEQVLKTDHEQAMIRYNKQIARMEVRMADISTMLEQAFSNKAAVLPKLDPMLEQTLIEKILTKVKARRSRLIVDISSGRNLGYAPKELAEINYFLKSKKITSLAA